MQNTRIGFGIRAYAEVRPPVDWPAADQQGPEDPDDSPVTPAPVFDARREAERRPWA